MVELKKLVVNKKIEVLTRRDGVLHYHGRLCVLNIDGLREKILHEAHNFKYSMHPRSTKMYKI